MIATGLDRLLGDVGALVGRRFGLLAHGASLTADLVPAHLALARRGCRPAALFGPEHGYYGVEQDMVASHSERDPWTGAPILSLYGCNEASLRPSPDAFRGLDLLLVDLQDVGSRYYTFAATAVWAAEAALRAGCEVWILDRPNPLGGQVIEGNLPAPGFESFVGRISHAGAARPDVGRDRPARSAAGQLAGGAAAVSQCRAGGAPCSGTTPARPGSRRRRTCRRRAPPRSIPAAA